MYAVPVGVVQGYVRNGSSSGDAVSGIDVDLHSFDGTNDRVVASTTTAGDGAYEFDDVAIDPNIQFIVSATFAGVPYYSSVLRLSSAARQAADVTVYQTTEDTAAVGIDRLSIVVASIDPKQRQVTIVESYHISNSTTSTYIGPLVNGQRQSLRFSMPGGAESLAAEAGFSLDDVVPAPSGFALTSPVLPGQTMLALSYNVRYTGTSIGLSRGIVYPTAVAEIIVPHDLHTSSPQLQSAGPLQFGGQPFDSLQASNLKPGAQLQIAIERLPVANASTLSLDALQTQLLIVFGIGAIAMLAVVGYRSQTRLATRAVDQRAFLVAEIARLDERFIAGELNPDSYREQRNTLKARLQEASDRPDSTAPMDQLV